MYLFWALILFSLLFDRFVGISLFLSAALFAGWELSSKHMWWSVFLVGIFESLLFLRVWGVPSAVFIGLAVLIWFFRQSVEAYRGLAVFMSGILGELVYRLVWGGGVKIWPLLVAGLVLYGVWWVKERWGWSRELYLR